MARSGERVLTVIHDLDDDPTITRAALAAHDPRRGQIVVHPRVGPRGPGILAADILAALGRHIAQGTARRQHPHTLDSAFAAAAAWVAADGIDNSPWGSIGRYSPASYTSRIGSLMRSSRAGATTVAMLSQHNTAW